MASPEQVHWKQGLFLQPQHLQLMQRHLLERINVLRQSMLPHPYGVISWSLDQANIPKTGTVRFRSLHVITKSGLELRYSEDSDQTSNTDLSTFDVVPHLNNSSGSVTIYLAVPTWQPQRPNSFESASTDPSRADALYRVRSMNLLDENEPNESRNLKPVEVRRYNACLMVHENVGGFETLPLLKIVWGTSTEEQGKPVRDIKYVPPCLLIDSSLEIRTLLDSLDKQIKAGREELAKTLVTDGFNLANLRDVQVGQLMKLQVLNRAAAQLGPLIDLGTTPLYDAYLAIKSIFAELIALHPTDDDKFTMGKFQHDNPYLSFEEIYERIIPYIPVARAPDEVVSSVPFELRAGRLIARLTDQQLSKPTHYYLCVQTSKDPTDLITKVNEGTYFKLKSLKRVNDAIPGVRLEYTLDLQLHKSLERSSGRHYFKLNRSEPMSVKELQAIAAEKEMAIKTPTQPWYEDARYALHMIVPTNTKG